MTRTLIIGGHSGIGMAISDRLLAIKPGHYDIPDQSELDVTNDRHILQWFRNHEGYDYIVYTPGVARLQWADDQKMSDWIDDYKVNVFGFAQVMGAHRSLNPEQRFSGLGIVSDAARNPMRGSSVYCSSKAALAMTIRVLAREWAGKGVRINGIAPAMVEDTPMTNWIDATVPGFRNWDPEKAMAYERSLLPMGRRIQKVEVAQVAVDVLYGPEYMTGSIVDITGGK